MIRIVLVNPGRRGLRRHIYIVVGFGNFLEFLNFGIILIPRIKIISENLEFPFKP
jgi:hypothetical protein